MSVRVEDLNWKFRMNGGDQLIRRNTWGNIRRGHQQLRFHGKQETKLILAAGGPSLKDHIEEIRQKRKDGYKLITVNGTHDYLNDLGIKPSAMVLLDARPGNSRFVKRIIPGCKYFVASQAHPDVFQSLEDQGAEIYIWHSINDPSKWRFVNEYYNKRWVPVVGGSTVALRAMSIAYVLGYRSIDVYGLDSCVTSEHHAYQQPENDLDPLQWLNLEERQFLVSPWHVEQADNFFQWAEQVPDMNINVHGDGLISYLLQNKNSAESINLQDSPEYLTVSAHGRWPAAI